VHRRPKLLCTLRSLQSIRRSRPACFPVFSLLLICLGPSASFLRRLVHLCLPLLLPASYSLVLAVCSSPCTLRGSSGRFASFPSISFSLASHRGSGLRFVCSSLFLSLHFVSLTSLTPARRNASQETLLNIFLPLSSSYVSHFPHSQQLNYPSKTFPSSVSTL
jgi:hypothetical protein